MDMINIKKLYHSLLKAIREERITGKARLVLAGAALGTGLLFSGCEEQIVTPDGQVATVTVDDQNNVSVTIDDQQQTPDTQDPVDDQNQQTDDNQQTDEKEEEIPEPQYVLKDENGDYYQPQAVSASDIYDKIAEVEEKYEFKNDWDRDTYVARLLVRNGYYMTDEDIMTIYDDYLANYGKKQFNRYSYDLPMEDSKILTKIDLNDYYIDQVLANEAKSFEKYFINGTQKPLVAENYYKTISAELENENTTIYNPLLNDENIFASSYSEIKNKYYGLFEDIDKDEHNMLVLTTVRVRDGLLNDSYKVDDYMTNEYISSHSMTIGKTR